MSTTEVSITNMVQASPSIQDYFKSIQQGITGCYELAEKARQKGLDPEQAVNIPLAKNMAERVVGLVSVAAPQLVGTNLTERIMALEQEYGLLDWRVGFKIAVEVAQGKICSFADKREAMEIGIRVGFAYLTLGIVSAPLEGFIGLKLKKRKDGKEYFSLQYAGPIRGAGGTAASTSVILGDYVRTQMGYAPYDPTEEEINRNALEIHDYHERVTNLQYHPSDQELRFLLSHLPVEVDGDPTEKIEVLTYRDLPRISTNQIRGGMALVVAEGLSQKAPKLWKRLSKWGKDFGLSWEWLADFLRVKEQVHSQHSKGSAAELGVKKLKPNNTYIMDLVAGRPILTHPLAAGGFRLRYGRTRTTGFSAVGLHPATLHLLHKFIAIGTQLKVERPGKAATATICEVIEGPIVCLEDGTVLQCSTEEEAKKVFSKVREILFLGDILFNYGDFSENGQFLAPPGYCPEWWVLEVEKAAQEKTQDGKCTAEFLARSLGMENSRVQELLDFPLQKFPSWREAKKISETFSVPLHPLYTYYWKLLSCSQLRDIVSWLKEGKLKKDGLEIVKLVLPFFLHHQPHVQAKRALELAGVPHETVNQESVVLWKTEAEVLGYLFSFSEQQHLEQLSLQWSEFPQKQQEQQTPAHEEDALTLLQRKCPIPLRDKAGTFIGARMGRPEKAKMRALTGSPQVMFPVGEEGDRLRSFQSALEKGKVRSTFPVFYCPSCRSETIYPSCEKCSQQTKLLFFCKICGILEKETCPHGATRHYKIKDLDIKYYFSQALQHLHETVPPELMKGIRGTSNKNHLVEHLAKGILRAKHNIYVNKDGTTRYDCTELPITHFTPQEIKTSLSKLQELGYTSDCKGNPLSSLEQVLELKPQDLILPGFNSLDESASRVLLRIAQFVDDLLVKFYQLPPYYNLKKEEDLIGHLVIGLAPHISAGLVGRIIGFSETQGLFAHPMYHAGLRRDCVHGQTKFVFLDPQRRFDLQRETIGPLVEGLLAEGAETEVIDAYGTLKVKLKRPLYAFGIDPEKKLMTTKGIKYFLKGPVPERWIRITTSSNRSYTMTPTHDFLHVVDNSFCFKKAKEIKVGDVIPLLGNFSLPLPEINELNILSLLLENVPERELSNLIVELPTFFKARVREVGRSRTLLALGKKSKNLNRWYNQTPLSDLKKLLSASIITMPEFLNQKARIRVKFSQRTHPCLLPITKALVSLLGYYAAEGYSRRSKWVSQICFRINNKSLQEEITQMIKEVFSLNPSLGEQSSKITIGDQLVYLLFKFCFKTGSNAYEKRVPGFIFHCKKELVATYLSAFIDGDGSVAPQRNAIVLYSVQRSLLDDMALLFSQFSIYARYHTTKARLPGKKVLAIYARLQKIPVSHILHHLVLTGKDASLAMKFLTLKEPLKKKKLMQLKIINSPRKTSFSGKHCLLQTVGDVLLDYVKTVELVEEHSHSYCVEVDWQKKEERNVLWGEQIINTRCDGDEACVMLLMDALLNFSRQYLPEKRGAKSMDAPLVLTATLNPTEVDDQVHGVDVEWKYPLEFYQAASEMKNPWEVRSGPEKKKITQLGDRLNTPLQYEGFGYTHPVKNINAGVQCSAYKILPSMEEKMFGQMEIARKVRAVDMDDVARLVIQKHFLRDIMGNLRKFSTQQFRCVRCNEKYRRPPLLGKCTACGNRLLFTITEGSVLKYLGPSLSLAAKYTFSPYLKQHLGILKINAEKVFGKEKEKQVGLATFA